MCDKCYELALLSPYKLCGSQTSRRWAAPSEPSWSLVYPLASAWRLWNTSSSNASKSLAGALKLSNPSSAPVSRSSTAWCCCTACGNKQTRTASAQDVALCLYPCSWTSPIIAKSRLQLALWKLSCMAKHFGAWSTTQVTAFSDTSTALYSSLLQVCPAGPHQRSRGCRLLSQGLLQSSVCDSLATGYAQGPDPLSLVPLDKLRRQLEVNVTAQLQVTQVLCWTWQA